MLKEKHPDTAIDLIDHNILTFLVAQMVKNPPAMQDTLVRFLGWEDPLERG